jgi:hypothetical protein
MFRRDVTGAETGLGRYWNDLVEHGEPMTAMLEPGLAETVARLYQIDDMPAPDPLFVRRLESQFRKPPGSLAPVPAQPPPASITQTSGQVARSESALSQSRAFWSRHPARFAAIAALLAILLATAAVIYIAGNDDDTSPPIPAAFPNEGDGAPSTSSGTIETLFSGSVDPSMLTEQKADKWKWVSFLTDYSERTMDEDAFTSLPYDHAGYGVGNVPGMIFLTVETGALSMVLDTEVQFYDGPDSDPQQIPPSTEVLLNAKDTVIFPAATGGTVIKQSDEILQVAAVGVYTRPNTPIGFERHDEYAGEYRYPFVQFASGFPAGSIDPTQDLEVTFQRVTLNPGGRLDYEVTGDSLIAVLMIQGPLSRLVHLPGGQDAALAPLDHGLGYGLYKDDPGNYSLVNEQETPVTFYLMRIHSPPGDDPHLRD